MTICVGGNENFPSAKAIGIGLIESAINLTRICLEFQPKELIFIGTCGPYERGEILQIYESSHAFNIEFSELNNFYNSTKIELCLEESAYKINSPNYICADQSAALKLANLGLDIENMEVFSALSVMKNSNINTKCFLCATNFRNENTHQDFMKSRQKVKEKLAKFIKQKTLIQRKKPKELANILDLLPEELNEKIQPMLRVEQICQWVYQKCVDDFSKMSNLLKNLREELAKNYHFKPLKCIKEERSKDGSTKYLFELRDGSRIEPVLLPMKEEKFDGEGKRLSHVKFTTCVPSQVGCRLSLIYISEPTRHTES